MDPTTARRYRVLERLPSELKSNAGSGPAKTRLPKSGPPVQQQVQESPGLEAKTLFEWLQREYPGRFSDGQIRTLQRQIRNWWRVTEGAPEKSPLCAGGTSPSSRHCRAATLPRQARFAQKREGIAPCSPAAGRARGHQQWQRMSRNTNPDDWVFPNERGKPLWINTLWYKHIKKPVLDKIGLGWVNYLVLRQRHHPT